MAARTAPRKRPAPGAAAVTQSDGLCIRRGDSTIACMDRPTSLTVFLPDALLADAEAGRMNFLARMQAALAGRGVETRWRPKRSYGDAGSGGWSLHYMDRPLDPFALVFRRVYMFPFWQIEAVPERWHWRVARAAFDPDGVDGAEARRWADGWRSRVHRPRFGDPSRQGFLFVPLQGRLTEHRSFQSCAPLAMLERTLARLPDRRLVATLHPAETYSDAERAALRALADRNPRLTLADGGSDRLLAGCDGVVTQNSAMAFHALFLGKPVLLFAGIDFHHACASVLRDGEEVAFATFEHEDNVDHDRYLFWFLQRMAINAGRPEAEARIMGALEASGFPRFDGERQCTCPSSAG